MAATGMTVGMKPPHPGSFIRSELLEPLDLSISKAAEILDVRRATLSNLLNEKSVLSAEMASRLEKAFGIDMDMMLRMQAWYDAAKMRAETDRVKVQPYRAA